jgi:hypothetical protein
MDQTSSAVSHSSNKSEFLVSGKYRLVRKIGSGSFGDIYLGINVTNGEVSFRANNFIMNDFHFISLIKRKSPSNWNQ